MATFRLDFDGMQTAMPRFARAARPIGVVALVGDKLLGLGQGGQNQRHSHSSALAQEHDERAPTAVANRVQLGVQAARYVGEQALF